MINFFQKDFDKVLTIFLVILIIAQFWVLLLFTNGILFPFLTVKSVYDDSKELGGGLSLQLKCSPINSTFFVENFPISCNIYAKSRFNAFDNLDVVINAVSYANNATVWSCSTKLLKINSNDKVSNACINYEYNDRFIPKNSQGYYFKIISANVVVGNGTYVNLLAEQNNEEFEKRLDIISPSEDFILELSQAQLSSVVPALGVSIISSVIALIIVFLQIFISNKSKREAQENYFKAMDLEISLVLKDCNGYRDDFKNDKLPLYKIKQIDPRFYLRNIESNNFGVLTDSLKQKLFLICDKIWLINYYHDQLLKASFDPSYFNAASRIESQFKPKVTPTLDETIKYLEELTEALKKVTYQK